MNRRQVEPSPTRFRAQDLSTWTTQLFEAWGYDAPDAAYLADTLIEANLRGIDSHGLMRIPAYRARIQAGLVNPAAKPVVTRTDAVLHVDAAGAPGQLAVRAAADETAALSSVHGVATATVSGSTHFGSAGYYARSLAQRGKIAIVVSNSEPIVVPHGGKSALLGTNPFAFAAPSSRHPVSLDMATSSTAMGKVLLAQARDQEIPGLWGVDESGEPTSDPSAVAALLPVGGPKGYGLAFMVEVLSGVLSGAAVAHEIGNMYTHFDRPQNIGHWMLAIDIAHVLPLDIFTARMDRLLQAAHSTPPAPGFAHVLAPGEPEESTRTQRLTSGIELGEDLVTELAEIGKTDGVSLMARSLP